MAPGRLLHRQFQEGTGQGESGRRARKLGEVASLRCDAHPHTLSGCEHLGLTSAVLTSSWGSIFDICLNSKCLPFLSCVLPRPLWVHYPQDVTTFSIDDQFLLGEKWGGQVVVGGPRSKHLWAGESLQVHREGRVNELVVQEGRRFGAPCLGTDLLSSELTLVCCRGCLAGSPCIRRWGSWCAGLSAWPRGGELRKGVAGNDGWWRLNGVIGMRALCGE